VTLAPQALSSRAPMVSVACAKTGLMYLVKSDFTDVLGGSL
jgi:hypothetical protein